MRKKRTAIFMALVLSAVMLAGCGDTASSTVSQASMESRTDSSAVQESADENSLFADGDYKDVTSEEANATITLAGSEGTISDTTRGSSGSEVTITSKGIYRVTGSSENVTITVNDTSQSGNIYLVLDNVSMTNTANACIHVQACDKLIIQCVGDNTLAFQSTDSSAKIDGAIYAKDDVTINGSGTLAVSSHLHGIVCKEDLKVTGASVSVAADSIGIQAEDCFKIGGGTVTVTSGHDGVQLSNDDNTSIFYLSDGTLNVNAGYDGLSVKTGSMVLEGGTANITAGGGSESAKNSDTSQKGIKCDGDITVSGADVRVSSADDAVHSDGNMTVNSGTLNLSSSDDGMTAAGKIVLNGGAVAVTKSYEGMEAEDITINGGDVSVTASDDGINIAGGSDSSLTINGGTVYVNASGDGLDSNGCIYITGGTTIVEGPTTNGNGALDKGDGSGCVASITGGTVLALGTTDMAVNFDTGTQCSALVNLSGESGTEISVDDGSGFTFTASKNFACAVYSSPNMTQGSSYTLTAGSNTAVMDFSSGLYYSNVSRMGDRPEYSTTPHLFNGRGVIAVNIRRMVLKKYGGCHIIDIS